MVEKMQNKIRCPWCLKDEAYMRYHDEVWGKPEYDNLRLFEKLNLDGAQAGLSWHTILIKTENYRKAFSEWNPEHIVQYNDTDIARLMQNKGIVRNRLKIESTINNAKAYLRLEASGIDFSEFLWRHVNHKPVVNHYQFMYQVPASTPLSDTLSRSLRNAGFKFVGTTIVYAFMQATGLVDDHLEDCWRRKEAKR